MQKILHKKPHFLKMFLHLTEKCQNANLFLKMYTGIIGNEVKPDQFFIFQSFIIKVAYWNNCGPETLLLTSDIILSQTGAAMAEQLINTLESYEVDAKEALFSLTTDNCSAILGENEGAHAILQQRLGKPIVMVGCDLHILSRVLVNSINSSIGKKPDDRNAPHAQHCAFKVITIK